MAPAEADGELLRRVAGRDPRAFELLYRRYARPVYGLALRRVGEAGGAEATQRAFAAIRRSAASFGRADGDSMRWVFRVAAGAIADGGSSEGDWLAFRVHAAVAELPAEERASLERAYWGDGSADGADGADGAVTADARSALLLLAARLDGTG